MKLQDITKDLSRMTDDELREHVKYIRHNKYVAKPAKAKRTQEFENKETRKKVSTIDKLLANMSDDEKAQLLLSLEQGEE